MIIKFKIFEQIENGKNYNNQQAVDKALEMKLTDKDLQKLLDNDMFGNNNWFELTEEYGIANDYDEAIQLGTEYVEMMYNEE